MQSQEKLNAVCIQFKEDIRVLFDDVVSVILYGSAATEDFITGISDLNFLVVLTDKGIGHIESAHPMIRRWQKKRISLPFFVTKGYIHASLDSFPIEFFSMQYAYRVIDGEDVLADLSFKKKDLRLQCERELKGKLLLLRQGLIMTYGRAGAMKMLINKSIITFVAFFRVLLYLKGAIVPKTNSEVIYAVCEQFVEIEHPLFDTLLRIHRGGVKKSKEELESLLKKYIQSIWQLSECVDKIRI
jgi:predicted nucleotidyltransferase